MYERFTLGLISMQLMYLSSHGQRKGEAAIAASAYASFWYSKDVIRELFFKGEAVILADDHYASLYKLNMRDWEKRSNASVKIGE